MQTYVRLSLGVISSLALSACFVFSDAELPIDPGGDGGQDSEVDSGPTCVGGDPLEGKIPCRPDPATTSSSNDGAGTSITFAIRDVIIDQSGAEVPVGLDLDGIDSSIDGESPSVGECTSAFPVANTDGPFGIDNVLGMALWPNIGNFIDFECELGAAHRQGLGTLLINISKWHFGRDDGQVEVFIAPAVAATHQPEWTESDAQAAIGNWDWGTRPTQIDVDGEPAEVPLPYVEDPGSGEPPPAPCWKEGLEEFDWFFANPYAVDPVQGFKIQVNNAFVADDWLVVPIPSEVSFDLYSDRRSVQVRLRQGYLFAKISTDRTRTEVAFAAGRFTVPDIKDVSPSIGFCEGHPGLDFSASYAAAADLFADRHLYSTLELAPGEEPPPCVWVEDEETIDPGALSVGVQFEAVKVSYGGVADVATLWEPPNTCELFGYDIEDPGLFVMPGSQSVCTALPDGQRLYPFTPPPHCND